MVRQLDLEDIRDLVDVQQVFVVVVEQFKLKQLKRGK